MRKRSDGPGQSTSPPVPGSLDHELTRRGLLLGGLGTAAALLTACSSSGGQSHRIGGGAAGSPAAGSAFPVTVAGKEGSATLTAAPRRVVAAGYLRDTDLALAFDAPLVGVARNPVFSSGLAPWQKPTTRPRLFATTAGMPYEQIAALHPDLILASDDYTLATDDAKLARIAPTLSYQTSVGGDSWQTMTRRAGKILGKSGHAEQLVTRTEHAIAMARRTNPVLAGKTFTFGPVSGLTSIYTINSGVDASAEFFGQLGMRLSPRVVALPSSSTPHRAEISPEQLDLLDADVLILTFSSPAVRKQFERQSNFQQLAAVRRGSYVALNVAPAVAVAFPSVLSLRYGLESVVPKLVAAARHPA